MACSSRGELSTVACCVRCKAHAGSYVLTLRHGLQVLQGWQGQESSNGLLMTEEAEVPTAQALGNALQWARSALLAPKPLLCIVMDSSCAVRKARHTCILDF